MTGTRVPCGAPTVTEVASQATKCWLTVHALLTHADLRCCQRQILFIGASRGNLAGDFVLALEHSAQAHHAIGQIAYHKPRTIC